MIKNIDPIELPCYRFYNLVLFYIKEGRDADQLEALEMDLARLDSIRSPFQSSTLDLRTSPYAKKRTVKKAASSESTEEKKPVMAPKATMAPSTEDDGYRPKWWNGDSANYVKARGVMMNPLPKMG